MNSFSAVVRCRSQVHELILALSLGFVRGKYVLQVDARILLVEVDARAARQDQATDSGWTPRIRRRCWPDMDVEPEPTRIDL